MNWKEFLKPNKAKLIILLVLVVLGFLLQWYDINMSVHFSADNVPAMLTYSLTWDTDSIFLYSLSEKSAGVDYTVCIMPKCETIALVLGVILGILIYYVISCFIFQFLEKRKYKPTAPQKK